MKIIRLQTILFSVMVGVAVTPLVAMAGPTCTQPPDSCIPLPGPHTWLAKCCKQTGYGGQQCWQVYNRPQLCERSDGSTFNGYAYRSETFPLPSTCGGSEVNECLY